MNGAILKYDAARQALAEARSIDEVKDWEDKAAAVREYARRSRNREMEIDALEIRVRAQRRRGELLAEMRAAGILVAGAQRRLVDEQRPIDRVTLAELDTSKDESSRAQKLASIKPDAFERLASRVRARLERDPEAHSFDVLKERDGPVNGARAAMASRIEPDDSLDFLPTPPWGGRTLLARVLPELGILPEDIGSAWESACGEGHISGVLEEAGIRVVATDIHDYSVDGRSPPGWLRRQDFLDRTLETPKVDWIITNPPFGDKALEFTLRAIELADVGVAMFLPLRFVETLGHYERLFRDQPPTLVAFFVERINLCKGRWDPDGSTATAYVWMVWVKGASPQPPFWIPPGCKERLTRPTDRDRFTQQPVGPLPAAHDGETGELVEGQGVAA